MNLELFRKDNLQVRIIKDENNEPLFCDDGFSNAMDAVNGLGNAVIPLIVKIYGLAIREIFRKEKK
ncbi:hypothetical protein C414_000260133 [Campylobacter jejuni subsp. jejuni 414]|nr:hypothetical protein C414_000260133 [Campylobacter jejuni subsp. jejuni 414]